MRVSLLTAIILGILFLPVYAQAPEPAEADTVKQMPKPEMTKKAVETEQAAEPEIAKEAEKPVQAAEPKTALEAEEAEEPAGMELNLTVKEMTFCAGVEEREPVSEDTTFSSDAGKIFFWSNVLNDGDEASIEHVWYYKGEEMARVMLPANYPRNRVWSSKIILPEWTGEWMVVIMAGSEKLGEMTCTVE
ncbi:MAG: DUF2914 domain-containing protein [Candidatus Zixiibacteriota bacterium]|nr:MAG: DUF2914 domain-containing protein [candidate division Zixibacteria bacterium]